MTNAEKYEEVFGFEPDLSACPVESCTKCPVKDKRLDSISCSKIWWNSEYREK